MDESTNTSHLDFLQLYKKTLVKLSLNDEKIDVHVDIAFPRIESFLKGEEVLNFCEKKDFVSPFLIHDVAQNLYFPFMFCSVNYGEGRIALRSELPIVNCAAKQLLENAGIKIDTCIDYVSIPTIYAELQSNLLRHQALDKIELVPFFSSHDKSILQYNSNFPFLYDYLFGTSTNTKYDSLFKEVRDKDFEKEIVRQSYGFFSREQRVLKRVDHYCGTKVNITERNVRADFFLSVLREFLKKKESNLIVVNAKMKERIMKLIKANKFDSFCIDYSSFSFSDILPYLEKVSYNELPLELQSEIRKRKEEQQRIIRFEIKQSESFLPLKDYINHDVLSLLSDAEKPTLIDVDLKSYDKTLFQSDCQFLDAIDQFSTLKETCVEDSPFYGLTIGNTRDNYSKLQLLVLSLLTKLKEFKNKIDSIYLDGFYFKKINSFNQYLFYQECVQLFSSYNGRLQIYHSGSLETDLKELKSAYQAVSASQLVLRNVFSDAVFSLDLMKLEKDYFSGFFKKRSVKRKLKSYLTSKNKIQFELLMQMIGTYNTAKANLDCLLPRYVEMYGKNVMTINGVAEIENNIEYIKQIDAFNKRFPEFDYDSVFVKRVLKEKDFRLQVVQKGNEVEKLSDEIKKLLNQYLEYYRGISAFYLNNISFEELIDKLSKESYLDYNSFNEYLRYAEKKEHTSSVLQLALHRYFKDKKKLSTFKKDFIFSVCHHVYHKCDENFAPYKNDYRKVREQYMNGLSNKKELDDIEHSNIVSLHIHEFLSKKENTELYSEFIEEMKRKELKYETLRKAFDLLAVCYPCSIVVEEDLYKIPDDLYDNVIIFGGETFSPVSLLSTYRVGKKRLFIYNHNIDKRVLGYHETTINQDNLYYRALSYQNIPSNFVNLLKNDCIEKGYSFILEGKDYPMVVQVENDRYGVFPNILLTSEMTEITLAELVDYLYAYSGIYLIYFNVYHYLFDEEDLFTTLAKKEINKE